MLTCKECGKEYQDLGSHVRQSHNLSASEYKAKYPGSVLVDEGLVGSRSEKRDHSSATAKALGTFSLRYEGGHPLKDPAVRGSQMLTREMNGFSYDNEKAKATNLEHYGVEHLSKTEERKETSRKLMQKLNDGRTAAVCPDPEKFKEQVMSGVPLYKLAEMYGFKSQWVIKNWIKDLGLPNGGAYRNRNANF